jgi:hypothetical protein
LEVPIPVLLDVEIRKSWIYVANRVVNLGYLYLTVRIFLLILKNNQDLQRTKLIMSSLISLTMNIKNKIQETFSIID